MTHRTRRRDALCRDIGIATRKVQGKTGRNRPAHAELLRCPVRRRRPDARARFDLSANTIARRRRDCG
jgi:hypothetical protein